MKRKTAIILIALLSALAAAYFIFRPDFSKKPESGIAAEPKQEETADAQSGVNSVESDVSTESESETALKSMGLNENKSLKNDKNVFHSKKSETGSEEVSLFKVLKIEETHHVDYIKDDTDWTLLEKIPRSDVVVVDKAYKVKSPKKYLFK